MGNRHQAIGNSKKFGLRKRRMIKRLLNQFLVSSADNPKSAIENRKLVGMVALVFTFAMCGAVASAQQATKIPRIGYLDPSTASGSAVRLDAFRQEMSKLGWIEGKNVSIETRFAEGKTDRLPELASELVQHKVDLIVVSGRAPGLAAKKVTTTIPIVMISFPDPVAAGMIASLARPGGNVAGFSSLNTTYRTFKRPFL